VPRLYVGIDYGPQIHQTSMYWVLYDPSVLSDICGGLILRCRHAMGHRIKLGLQNKRVIRRMYKICLLTADLFCAILRVNLTGAAPAD
jgi:hypothetical protein